jgi:hypothetical protein
MQISFTHPDDMVEREAIWHELGVPGVGFVDDAHDLAPEFSVHAIREISDESPVIACL